MWKTVLNFPGTPAVKDPSSRDRLPKLISLHKGRGLGNCKLSGLVLGIFSIYWRLANLLETRGRRPWSQRDLQTDSGQEMIWPWDCCYNRLCVLLPFVATQTLSGKGENMLGLFESLPFLCDFNYGEAVEKTED